jgi:predicted lipid-binding transport protein (Tim44 family)
MRDTHILLAAASAVLIGLAGFSHAAPAANSAPQSSASTAKTGNRDDRSSETPPPVIRPPQQLQPFYCFGDAACEREMARQGRPVADPKQRDSNEGPYINGIPGQTDVPGFGSTPVPVVPGR